ncbi:MAG: molybdopterin-binding protein [Mangrovicoccus sp.]|nr:molybdopterin-binding protein [Mangrovicoccus sp.]
MSRFDRFIIVDWSGGNDRGPRPCRDAIWTATAEGGDVAVPIYHRNRAVAEAWLAAQCDAAQDAGERLLLGFDFPFGYPAGFAERLTGKPEALAVWEYLAAQIEDAPKSNNRFDLAARINRQFDGPGPFWGNALGRDIAGLARGKPSERMAQAGLREWRAVEEITPGAFSCWQLAGAGAVGSQCLMGLPVLARLRAQFGAAAWPFEPWDGAGIVLTEVFPSLLAAEVKAAQAQEPQAIRDALQVRLLAGALQEAQSQGRLTEMLDGVPLGAARREEGWILGVGQEAALRAAARPDLRPPQLKNDCFALPPGVDWTPVDQALAHLRAALHPVTGIETCPTAQAAGRVLAKDAIALRANPPGANSAVDGYGFAASAIGQSGPQVLPLVDGRAAAGAPLGDVVPHGQAVRILTGALLPEGVDTVVLEEDCALSADAVGFEAPVKPGANARKAGEDVAAGALALKAGRRLQPQDLALASALGLGELATHAPLRVGVISTGDELAAPGSTLDPARTYDANRPMLLALAAAWGHQPVDLGHVPDDRDALRAAFDHAATETDVILSSGGASAGDEDHVSALLQSEGAMQSWRIAIKPGRPLALALWQGVPVFGLPGNPVAAFVCALIFAHPAMARLAGADWPEPQAYGLPAAFEKRKKPGRREYLRARVNGAGQVEVFASEGSGRISGLVWADGLVELPDEAMHIRPGDMVRYLPNSSFGF